MLATPFTSIDHVNQLLTLHGTRFVTAAYRTLLGREPDPHGSAQYLARLLRDGDRVAIVQDMAMSEEGLRHQHEVIGLKELIDCRTPSRNWFSRFLNKSRRLEQSTSRTEATLCFLGNEMHTRLTTLENLISQLGTSRSEQERRMLEEIDKMSERLEMLGSMSGEAAARAQSGSSGRLAHQIEQPANGHPKSAAGAANDARPLSVENLVSMATRIRAENQ